MGVAEYDPYGPVVTPGRVARPPDVSFGYAHETSALESGASDMKQMADLVAAQMHALRGIVARHDAAGSATAKALEAREAAETEWWDAREAASDSKLISYQKTDHYVKRAATRAAAQRKFVTNKNAGKSLGEACEDLRLASLVLKQTHDEETACANENAKRDAKLADAVKREHDALRAFRSETNAAAETVARSMAELKDNLDRAAVAAARQAKEAREAQASVLAASVLAAENKNRHRIGRPGGAAHRARARRGGDERGGLPRGLAGRVGDERAEAPRRRRTRIFDRVSDRVSGVSASNERARGDRPDGERPRARRGARGDARARGGGGGGAHARASEAERGARGADRGAS